MSSVEAEIELLERVLFRLGTAETDEQLEGAVIKFLTPVLVKIMSANEAVRCKVMEVLTHINKRLKSRPAVQLPVDSLLTQYQTTSSTFLHNFSIIYITMGFPRLTVEKQTELVPVLLNCLEGKPENHQDKLLMLVLPLLGSIKIPDDPENRSALLGLEDKPSTKKQFIALLQDVLLLPYGVTTDTDVPAGMSSYSFKRVNTNNWKAEDLEHLKKGVVRFLCSGVFSDEDVLVPLVLASSDTRFSVATPAIAELGKVNSSLDWSNPNLSATFYTLFLGNSSKIAERKTSACSARLRQKLLQYLLKSKGKGVNVVRGVQVIFEALFGENTNQKCKVLALQFTKNLVKEGSKDLISKISKVILSGVVKLIGVSSTEQYDIQNAAYVALAQIAYVCPDIVNKDLQLVIACFDHLLQAPVELHNSIRESLIAIAPAFRWDYGDNQTATRRFVPDSNHKLLLTMLSEHAESNLTIVRNVTSTFLTTCFPQHFVPARYLLLLLVSDDKSTLRDIIMQHLYGVTKKDHINYSLIVSIESADDVILTDEPETPRLSGEQSKVILPSFKEMVTHVCEMNQKRNPNSAMQKFVHDEILEYLRLCLWSAAGIKSGPDDPKHVGQLNKYIRNNYELKDDNELNKYLNFIKQILKTKRGVNELSCLYDLLNAEVEILTQQCFDFLDSLGLALKDVSESTRVLVAKIVGILWAISDDGVFNEQIKTVLQSLTNRSLEHRHGSILAISHAYYRKIKSAGQNKYNSDDFKKTILLLCEYLSDQQPLLSSAACKGLALIGSVTCLPFPDVNESTTSSSQSPATSSDEKMNVDDDDKQITKTSVMETILGLLKSAHTRPKIREEAAMCLGYLAIGDGEFFTSRNLNEYTKLIKLTKDTALIIAIAQGIVYTILGYDNTSENRENDISDQHNEQTNPHCNDERLATFVLSIIKIVSDPNPASRISSAIWLLALVKNCSKRAPIYTQRQMLQFAFTELLSDDSEFVQDVASRGMGLVFSLSDPNDQSDLANSLLNQLIGGKRRVNQVEADTQIFEEGTLGKTPMGGNITTYKELCSLASDLNQPEMIYKFMQLANHNAAWNSKLGAAFGLKSIAIGAGDQMQPFLGKIVPRLYRYKYDPTPKIQNSMCSIWDSIVKDSKETVEKHYWAILDELITNLTHTEWRVRIACCLAIRDLIKRPNGLKLRIDEGILNKISEINDDSKMEVEEAAGSSSASDAPVEKELLALWTQLFRVMDDYHEGTRLAAESTAKTLSKVCIVASSNSHSKSAQIVASTILPLILNTGITHTVAEIRQLSMKTLAELIDSSGPILTAHIATLVPCLLKATGELEIPKLSLLSTQFGANAEVQEVIDNLRADAAKQNQTTESLTKCVRYIDIPALEKMTPDIVELIKSSVNLGTKIASAHFICLITIRFNQEMQPLTSKYLSACFNSLKDRNNIVRKYYASAIGHLIGVAKEQSVVRLFAKLTELYFENQSNRGIPQSVAAINKRHQEILKDYSGHILPLIFFAMHEQVTEETRATVTQWRDLWTEISPGDAGIRMNLDSILPTLVKCLEDPSWAIKAQSANAINTIATRLGSNLGNPERKRLVNALLSSMSGRTFQGKERILEALASLCKGLEKDETQIHKQIIDAVMKECHKEEPNYRTHALKAIGDILEQLNEDRFEEVYNMVWYLMDKKDLASATGDEDDKLMNSDERNKRALIFINLKDAVCEALGKAWPADSVETQNKYQRMFVERCVQCLQNNTRPVQLALLVALDKFVNRLKCLEKNNESGSTDSDMKEKKQKIDSDENLYKICKDILSAVVYISGIPHTGLKKEALNIVLSLLNKLTEKKALKEIGMVKSTFENILPSLQKDNTPEIKCRLKDIEDKLKTV